MGETAVQPTCCICFNLIDVGVDPTAVKIRLTPLADAPGQQLLYAHSSCIRECVHDNIDFWWE